MKNKILFFQLILIFGAVNVLKNINSMSMSDIVASEFADSILNESYFEGADAQLQVRECIDLIRNYDFEIFEKYFIAHKIDPNLILELEENDDEEMNEKESKESSESYSKKDNGKTLLMFAVEKGDLRLIEFLISKGANVNAMTKDCQMTPLSIAVIKNDINSTKLLINNKANINSQEYEVDMKDNNLSIENVLPIYFMKSEIKLEMVKLFLDKDYDLDATVENNNGWTILQFALNELDFNIMINKRIIAMLIFKAKEKNIDMIDMAFNALEIGNDKLIKYLICLKLIDINAKDYNGHSLLFKAISEDDLNLVELLLKLGSDVNFQSTDEGATGSTPLMIACRYGFVNIVITLLNAGADISAKDSDGETCFAYLDEENNKDASEIIREILHQWSLLTTKEVMQTSVLPREISGLIVGILNNDNPNSQELAEIERSVLKEEAGKKAFFERQAARIAEKISKGYDKFIAKNSKPLEKEIKQKKRKNIS